MRGSHSEEERLLRALHASRPRLLLAYVQRLAGGNRQLAEDIVQETLATPRREVIAESYHQGHSRREIAARLNIQNETVRSRMFYALRASRLALLERGVHSP